ncbi:MAG: DUF1036 domain-containing protein [Alphaproteobacteria bacterium]|nr:DUF1036 domain-containing protein [Alphaproteobacteria bacterium]MCL2505290.1 DUF1036 domain-containing protein [Alphaproteobacteria bacterium]
MENGKWKITIVLAAVVFVMPVAAQAKLQFCNKTSAPIEAAVGYRESTADSPNKWTAEGWWHIEPGKCAVVYDKPLTQRFYFAYAHSLAMNTVSAADGTYQPRAWDGKYMFCVKGAAFKLESADGGGRDCLERKLYMLGFEEVDVKGQAEAVYDFTDF